MVSAITHWLIEHLLESPSAARDEEALVLVAVDDDLELLRLGLAQLRAQAPLPETADELCAVAETLGSLREQSERRSVRWLSLPMAPACFRAAGARR